MSFFVIFVTDNQQYNKIKHEYTTGKFNGNFLHN